MTMTAILILAVAVVGWIAYDTRRILKEATKEDETPKE